MFLGNAFNPLSIRCLEALMSTDPEVLVGVHNPVGRRRIRVVRKMFSLRGGRVVFRKAMILLVALASLALRRMGIPVRRFRSLWDLCYEGRLKPVHCVDPNAPEFIAKVRSLGVDLIVVAAFSRILKSELISLPPLGCVNVHPSLLPRYRGPYPFYWVLANREKTTGITLHYIDEGIDSGEIIVQREFAIPPGETEIKLQYRSARAAAEMLKETLPLLIAGMAPRTKQDEFAASYYSWPPKGRSVL